MNGDFIVGSTRIRRTDQGGCQHCLYRDETTCYKHWVEITLGHICNKFKKVRL